MSVLPVGIGSEVGAGGYQIERSLRFNSADSAYLSRTPSTTSNRRTWTWSGWIKRGSANGQFLTAGSTSVSNGFSTVGFAYSETAYVVFYSSSSHVYSSNAIFRDPSAWYHVVYVVDTTQATTDNRVKLYVNGSQVTLNVVGGYTAVPQNFDCSVNTSGESQIIGADRNGAGSLSGFHNGYMTEINFIDGQALDPTSFGEFNEDTGVWQPKAYTGSYGTNGFYLDFADNSGTTSTTLGADSSGNGNNWTPNNFSVTAGAGNDSLVDSPTRYGTGSAGGDVRGNFCTLNPLKEGSGAVFSNGNLDITQSTTFTYSVGTIGVTSGKWYWEVTVVSGSSYQFGIQPQTSIISQAYRYSNNGFKYPLTGAGSAYGDTFTNGDVIGVAYDGDNGDLYFYKNGTVQNSGTAAFTGLNDGTVWMPWVYMDNFGGLPTAALTLNFGQRAFAHTVPSGFKALCTTNLPEPTIADGGEYFNVIEYEGNGATGSDDSTVRTVTDSGVRFTPDLVWWKCRNNVCDEINHYLFTSAFPSQTALSSNTTSAQSDFSASSAGGINGFTFGGFTIAAGSNNSSNNFNKSGSSNVAWNWKANGAGVSNTDGTITSTVSVNTTSGFSIVTWSQGASNQNVGHGLGVTPAMIIGKTRSNAGFGWHVFHQSLGVDKYIFLNLTNAAATSSGIWSTLSSTTFGASLGLFEENQTQVAYCFAPVSGFSSMGSYVGNGSADGPFVYTGFRPAFVLIKSSSSVTDWNLFDSVRGPYNPNTPVLRPNSSGAEATASSSTYAMPDFLSNGFKLRTTSGEGNGSGSTYIYMAFAENPFQYSLAR